MLILSYLKKLITILHPFLICLLEHGENSDAEVVAFNLFAMIIVIFIANASADAYFYWHQILASFLAETILPKTFISLIHHRQKGVGREDMQVDTL